MNGPIPGAVGAAAGAGPSSGAAALPGQGGEPFAGELGRALGAEGRPETRRDRVTGSRAADAEGTPAHQPGPAAPASPGPGGTTGGAAATAPAPRPPPAPRPDSTHGRTGEEPGARQGDRTRRDTARRSGPGLRDHDRPAAGPAATGPAGDLQAAGSAGADGAAGPRLQGQAPGVGGGPVPARPLPPERTAVLQALGRAVAPLPGPARAGAPAARSAGRPERREAVHEGDRTDRPGTDRPTAAPPLRPDAAPPLAADPRTPERSPGDPAPLPAPPLHAGEPALAGAVLRHAAHLRVETPATGPLELHLRVRDGVAHLRIEGDGARLVEGRAGELSRALAGEGLRLGQLDLPARPPSEPGHAGASAGEGGGRDPRQDRPEPPPPLPPPPRRPAPRPPSEGLHVEA